MSHCDVLTFNHFPFFYNVQFSKSELTHLLKSVSDLKSMIIHGPITFENLDIVASRNPDLTSLTISTTDLNSLLGFK